MSNTPTTRASILLGIASIAVSAFPWAALFVLYVLGVGWDFTFVSRFMLAFILAGLILSLVAAAKSSRLWLILTAIDAVLLAFVLAFISDVHIILRHALSFWRG
jgi:hypothetical protein